MNNADLIGRSVTVLTYDHEHGVDSSVHVGEAAARHALAGIVRLYWGDAAADHADMPDEAPDDDGEAIRLYFDAEKQTECYYIDTVKVQGTHATIAKRDVSAPLIADAKWVASFGPGERWTTGAFTDKRQRLLIQAGALVPVDGEPGYFLTGCVKIHEDGTVTRL